MSTKRTIVGVVGGDGEGGGDHPNLATHDAMGLATDAALNSETTARTNADAALDGRLDTVEAALPAKADTADSRFPSAGEKAALVGTNGTPGSGNKFVTNSDSRNTDARTPTAHALDGAAHTVTGLTVGHVVRATGASTFAFGAIQDSDLPGTIARDTEVADAITTHEGLADPHPGYLTPAEGNVLYDAAGAAAAAAAASQPHDADLDTIAALDSSTAGALATDGSGWIRKTYAQLKTALGLVKADVGLGNVDNTSDANKPVSTAQQTALDLKAPLASPTFTGIPAAPTASQGTNTTQVASTAYVQTEAGLLVAKSLVDAAGDLYVGTADNAVGRLAKGTAYQALRVKSDASTLEWGVDVPTFTIATLPAASSVPGLVAWVSDRQGGRLETAVAGSWVAAAPGYTEPPVAHGFSTHGPNGTDSWTKVSRLTADTAGVISSTTLVNSGLSIAVAANEVWEWVANVFYTAGTTGDCKFGWTFPSGMGGRWGAHWLGSAETASPGLLSSKSYDYTETPSAGAIAGGNFHAQMGGVFVVNSTGGTAHLQYAQRASEAVSTVLLAASYIRATRLA